MSNSTQEGTPALVKIFTGIIVLFGGYFNPGIISSLALSQTIASLSVVHGAASVQPLEQITIISQPGGTIIVKDGERVSIYLRTSSDERWLFAQEVHWAHILWRLSIKNGDTAAEPLFASKLRPTSQTAAEIRATFSDCSTMV